MPKYLDPKTVRAVQLTALANGGSIRCFSDGSPSRTVEWDIGGKCLSPVRVELHGRASEGNIKMVNVTAVDNRPAFVEMDVRCRRCENCLKQRAYMWSNRCRVEWRDAPRTWLATLTLAPEQYARLLSVARVSLARQGCDLEALPEPERWLAVEKFGFEDVQLWLKRIRKATAAPLRYLAVTEAHKSGVPHWHVLLHEQSAEKPLRYKSLKGSWSLGFDSYTLVQDARGASYVAKYLAKELRARVRASLRYGGGKPVASAPPQAV